MRDSFLGFAVGGVAHCTAPSLPEQLAAGKRDSFLGFAVGGVACWAELNSLKLVAAPLF